jgi:hypothetical protein
LDFNEKIDFTHFMCAIPFTLVYFIPELRNIFVLRLDFPLTGSICFYFLFHWCFLCHRHQIEFWPVFSLPSVFGSAVLQPTARSLCLFSRSDFQRRPGICLARWPGSALKNFVRRWSHRCQASHGQVAGSRAHRFDFLHA